MQPKMPAFSTCIRPDGMKLLALGHSNCRLSASMLCPIFDAMGYKDFKLGVIYRGDSDFGVHAQLINEGAAGIAYHRSTIEKFYDPADFENLVTHQSVLEDQPWDTVVLYQGGGSFNEHEQFGKPLSDILDLIEKNCPNAKVFYGMHWPYPVDNQTAAPFKKYGCDADAMYQAGVNAAKKYILPNKRFAGIIPAAALMQSLRTKYGEVFHVTDRVHINSTGCFVVGLLWYAVLTGLPLGDIDLPEDVDAAIVADAKAIIPQLLEDPFTIIDLNK